MATCDATSIAILTTARDAATTAATAANAIVTAQDAIVTAQQTIADNIGACIAALVALNNPSYNNAIALLRTQQQTAIIAAQNASKASAQAVIDRDNATLNATQYDNAALALNANATGATAGSPGTWTPSGSDAPLNLAQAIADAIVASPNTAWTTGQHVITRSGTHIHWSGTAWVAGDA